MTENQRLKVFINALGVTQKEIAEKLKMQQGSLSDVLRAKNNVRVSDSIKYKLENLYNLNREWLETGEGELFIKTPRLEAVPLHLGADPRDFDNDGNRFEELPDGTIRMRVPVIPYKAYAGYLRGHQDPEYYEDLPHLSIEVFRQHRGTYIAFEVRGDSMTTLEPEHFRKSIFDGVKVVGRELPKHQWEYKLHTHAWDAWVIVHRTEGILIKQIIEHDVEQGTILVHSLNPDKTLYPDQKLSLNDINQIFNVVKKIDD